MLAMKMLASVRGRRDADDLVHLIEPAGSGAHQSNNCFALLGFHREAFDDAVTLGQARSTLENEILCEGVGQRPQSPSPGQPPHRSMTNAPGIYI